MINCAQEKALGRGMLRAKSPVSVEIHRKDNEQGAERKETDKVDVHALTPCQLDRFT